ncbi:MAG TPA: BlaI/MecI/CopY family transcriptional regulator [Luteitalea sp.]|nr:BlaI/MecI/CopY family transcriptional regulator [Luteitalea sp.]
MPVSPVLTRREREILNAVFALGNRASAEQIRQRLTAPPTDSSVRVMLGRLERKGLLEHVQDGARFLYSATRSPAIAKRSAIRELVDTFFDGSRARLLTTLVGQGSWSDDELDQLEAAVERARLERQVKSGRN